jgi:nitroreductase
MIIKEILSRRSVREYKSDEVSDELITKIIKAGYFSPSARSNHAIEFIVIKNQTTKNSIFDIVGQEFIKEVPVLIIPVTDTTKTDLPIQDLSVVSENMFLQAAALRLGTVWKNLDPIWAEKIKKILDIPENFTIINVIPVGYSKEQLESHQESDFDENKIHKEGW